MDAAAFFFADNGIWRLGSLAYRCCSTNARMGSPSVIKPELSPINLLGKLFFRRQAPWQQRQKMMIVCWTLTVGMLVGGAVVGLMLLQNSRH